MSAYSEIVELWRTACDECNTELLPPGYWSHADRVGAEVAHDAVAHSGVDPEGEDG